MVEDGEGEFDPEESSSYENIVYDPMEEEV